MLQTFSHFNLHQPIKQRMKNSKRFNDTLLIRNRINHRNTTLKFFHTIRTPFYGCILFTHRIKLIYYNFIIVIKPIHQKHSFQSLLKNENRFDKIWNKQLIAQIKISVYIHCSQLLYLKHMSGELKIVQVLNTNGTLNNQGLVFKMEWVETKQIAFMQFQTAKKKYPNIVLEYLVSKIKQKPAQKSVLYNNQYSQKKSYVSPVTQYSEHATQEKVPSKIQKYSPVYSIKNFFSQCTFCKQKQNIKIFDCDAMISKESNIAYAVYFRLPHQNKTQRTISKSPKEKRRRGIK